MFVGLNTREINTLYVIDDANNYGFLHNYEKQVVDGQDANFHIKIGVQSDKMYYKHDDITFPFKNYPMQELVVNDLGLA